MSATTSPNSNFAREFLGWDQPALPLAARRLAERRRQDVLDLGNVIVVVPGLRAGRRLRELLVILAEEDRLLYTPPRVVTESVLPELHYTPKLPFANNVTQELAWARALRDSPPQQRGRIVPSPPADDDMPRWLALGKMLRRLHVELAADAQNFAAVQKHISTLGNQREAERWQALVDVQASYHAILHRLQLWDMQSARLKAIEAHEIQSTSEIVLLGTVDLNDALRQMLAQVAGPVTAYIVAPAELAERFDELGCLIASAWADATIPLRDEQIRQVEGPIDQADAVSDWLADLGAQFATDEVVIGVPDESLAPQLQRQLKQSGVASRWVEGIRIGETLPYRLLATAVKFADGQRYEDLAALVRHPDVENWLGVELAEQLDCYHNDRLPSRIRASSVVPDAKHWPELPKAVERIETWLATASGNHPLHEWAAVFRVILAAIFGQRTVQLDSADDETLRRSLELMVAECERLETVPAELDSDSISAAHAFQIALGELARTTLPPPADPNAVQILGWLELPLDDAPALLVTSFNEGFVPTSAAADAFLPDRLRRDLGLLHNDRRYARDAYATSVLAHSRAELRIVFARRGARNDPLHPSRLLFTGGEDALVARARKFFDEPKTRPSPRRLLLAPNGNIPDESRFVVPEPQGPYRPLDRISVTRFKTYLACPYRYYLRHVRGLEAIDDAARELNGGKFGSLLHCVLGEFGSDERGPRHSSNAKDIFDYLHERLAAVAERFYGSQQRRPAIRLQLEQTRRRLDAFARQQAGLVNKGWRIVHVEGTTDLEAPFPLEVGSITLAGRIDRIDHNAETSALRIIDYKTADAAQKPKQTHLAKEQWIDLQLPLYRHLRTAIEPRLPAHTAIELAYFNLPKAYDDAGLEIAEWDASILDTADAKARWVIAQLRNEVFWPAVRPAPKYGEEFAAICLDNIMSGPAIPDEQGDPA